MFFPLVVTILFGVLQDRPILNYDQFIFILARSHDDGRRLQLFVQARQANPSSTMPIIQKSEYDLVHNPLVP